ncbi:tumor suppressor candidate 3-like [Paramacrobiotus metropolitanus]|uniref:tumor suppressor candidate 3-like n=1 Tax=Paramacrobiotus metropolitanus TaxID=2943436 RepID=UPI002445B9DC|nr:tumor suppressor candidate 3-like [Paramacrobiotus metropolitanus]
MRVAFLFAFCAVLSLMVFFSVTNGAMSLGDRITKLNELSNQRPIIRMNTDKYREFVKTTPRNYSIILMLTALNPSRGCGVCQVAHEEYDVVASSYRLAGGGSDKLFFTMVDFDEGHDVFTSLKANSAPIFMHIPPQGKPKDADTMNIQVVGYNAETIAKWVAERTGITIRIVRKPNYGGVVAFSLLMLLVGGFLYIRRNSLEFLNNRSMYAWIVVALILFMTSGQMWNHIRGPPFMQRHPQSKQWMFIHGSSQGQYVAETYIVMSLNLAVAIGFILLNEAAKSTNEQHRGRNKVMAIAGIVLVGIFFSALKSIFRAKYQGYPYSFLFK